jgi:hypothetical protein
MLALLVVPPERTLRYCLLASNAGELRASGTPRGERLPDVDRDTLRDTTATGSGKFFMSVAFLTSIKLRSSPLSYF